MASTTTEWTAESARLRDQQMQPVGTRGCSRPQRVPASKAIPLRAAKPFS